ncbi:MAG: PHP domain-containing protein, partial [Rhodobacteraceae bacterium]|nr:PHP domain-containing protein [Paracoccaceae bacterium]
MTSQPRFIHLRVHTEYSLLEGAVRVKKLPGMCADMGMPAVAITDTNSLFAALEFSVTASGAGVQPIIGCQVDVAPPEDEVPNGRGQVARPAPIVLLAQNETGYENLMKL